jgi:hypothetical protein
MDIGLSNDAGGCESEIEKNSGKSGGEASLGQKSGLGMSLSLRWKWLW